MNQSLVLKKQFAEKFIFINFVVDKIYFKCKIYFKYENTRRVLCTVCDLVYNKNVICVQVWPHTKVITMANFGEEGKWMALGIDRTTEYV